MMDKDLTVDLYQRCLNIFSRHVGYARLENSPSESSRAFGEGTIAVSTGRYGEAVQAFTHARSNATAEVELRANCGMACVLAITVKIGDAREVISQTDPFATTCVEDVFDLAVLARHLGLHQKALDAQAAFQRLTAPDYRLYCELAFLEAQAGHFEAAAAAARKAEVIIPSTSEAAQLLAHAYLVARQGREVVRILGRVLTPASSSEAWYVAAARLADASLLSEARALLDQALAVHPEDGMLYGLLGMILYDDSQWLNAIEAFQRAIYLVPDDPGEVKWKAHLCTCLARTYWQLGEWTSIIDSLERAAELNPADGEAAYLLGEALMRNGREPEAFRARRLAEASADERGINLARKFLTELT